ncbi:MAG: hypothetical protein QOC92_2295, partial [Acidimicrobiaceae bacterium]
MRDRGHCPVAAASGRQSVCVNAAVVSAPVDVLDEVRVRLIRRGLVIGFPLGTAMGVYHALWAPLRRDISRPITVGGNIVLAVVIGAVLWVALRRRVPERIARELAWLTEQRPGTDGDRAALLGLPRRLSLGLVRFMLVVTVVTAGLNYGSGRVVSDAVQVLVGLGLTSLVLGALAY